MPVSHGDMLVAVELDARENTLDACTDCGCRVKGELRPGGERAWWFIYGLAEHDAREGWKPVAFSSYCGGGSFEKAAADFRRSVGTPYVILNLAATAAASPAGNVNLETEVRLRKLSGFDRNGKPLYRQREEERVLSFTGEGDLTLPLFIPDDIEKESFRVHEVILKLRATALRRKMAPSYGMISVSADVPGAEILLDGGFVGRTAGNTPTLLKNVPSGEREVRVRDFSGREARREVTVEKNTETRAALRVLNLAPAGPRESLIPIGRNPQGYEEYWRVRDGASVVMVPDGAFLMGRAGEDGKPDERPQRKVSVSGFIIDKTEVTWRQYRKFAEDSGAKLPPAPLWGTPGDYPASFVLWEEANAYCEWVGGRLPTEAEWEKAARGVDGRTFSWGDEWDPGRCNAIDGGPHRPESVGSFPDCVSPYGVLDMSGGMWEWCADWYQEDYYRVSSHTDPRGPASGRLRVIRGGGWMSQPLWLQTAHRHGVPPSTRKSDHGFRCARDAPESRQ